MYKNVKLSEKAIVLGVLENDKERLESQISKALRDLENARSRLEDLKHRRYSVINMMNMIINN